MKSPDQFSSLPMIHEPSPLPGETVEIFIEREVKPVTKAILGIDFEKIKTYVYPSEKRLSIASPNGFDEIAVGMFTNSSPSLKRFSLAFYAEGYCDDLTAVMPKSVTPSSVWDVTMFTIPINSRQAPRAERFYTLRSKRSGMPVALTDEDEKFLLTAGGQMGLRRRSPRLTEEDILTARAILDIIKNGSQSNSLGQTTGPH